MSGPVTGAPTPFHPIVAAALRSLGTTPEDVVASHSWRSRTPQTFKRPGLPRVSCSPNTITVHIPFAESDDDIVFYMYEDMAETPRRFWLHQLEFRNWMPPETIVPGLPGRRASDLVGLPGIEGLVIVEASEQARGLVLDITHHDEIPDGEGE